jgi:hypothetical protein
MLNWRYVLCLVAAVFCISLMPTLVLAESGAATITKPPNVNLGALIVGANPGNAMGSVTANTTGWTLTVQDAKTNNKEYMTVDGEDTSGAIKLSAKMQFGNDGMTFGDLGAYQSALQSSAGYGAVGTFEIPFFVKQMVTSSDKVGSYKITITFTATPVP